MSNHPMYIVPQQLVAQPQQAFATPGSAQQSPAWEPAAFVPGAVHSVMPIALNPTPQSILNGSFSTALSTAQQQTSILFFPRLREHSGLPSFPSISFSVNGHPGPYIKDIIKNRVEVDGAEDAILDHHGWSLTRWMIDWPGITLKAESIHTRDPAGKPITRAILARQLSGRIAQFIVDTQKGAPLPFGPQVLDQSQKGWAIGKIHYADVRLLGLSYYQRMWIPILGLDP